jgi:cobalt/nickel transport system permease protein
VVLERWGRHSCLPRFEADSNVCPTIIPMTLAFEQSPCPDSSLRRLDPRWKLAALVLAAAGASALGTVTVAGAFFGLTLILAGVARVPWVWYLRRLAGLAVVLLIFVVLLPFVVRDDGPSISVGPLQMSRYGLTVAGLLCLKAFAIVTLMIVVLVSAPLDATLKAAHALRVPGLLIQLVVLTYRYVFLLIDELARLLIALRVRGYRLRPRRPRLRMLGLLTGTMLVRGYERAERVGQAMRCRGFDGHFRSLTEMRSSWRDVLAFVAIVTASAGLVVWDILLRRG